ncbi:hypothetical protein EON63_10805, partial [archaeon]
MSYCVCVCRTDAGVHALRNVFQVDVSKKPVLGKSLAINSSEECYDPSSIKRGLNYYLRPDKSRIFITDVTPEREDFVARREASARTYMYRILNRPPSNNLIPYNESDRSSGGVFSSPASYWSLFQHDLAWTTSRHLHIDLMVQASQLLIGMKDFASFRNASCQSKSSVKHVTDVSIY